MNSGTPLPGDAGPPLRTPASDVVDLAPQPAPQPRGPEMCPACGHEKMDPCPRGLTAEECTSVRVRVQRAEIVSMNVAAEPGKTFETRGSENDTLAAAVQEFIGDDDDDYGLPPADEGTRAGEFLRQAADIVDGARNQTHGDKERSFEAIARLWTVYLGTRKNYNGVNIIRAKDVAAMMVLLKFARAEWGDFVPDHAVDAAGYSAIFGELAEAEKRQLDLDRDDF